MTWNELFIMKDKYINGTLEITKDGRRYQATIIGISKTKNTIRLKIRKMVVLSEDDQWKTCHNRPIFIKRRFRRPLRLELDVITINNNDSNHPIQYFMYPKNF
jgi:hypothetical protein